MPAKFHEPKPGTSPCGAFQKSLYALGVSEFGCLEDMDRGVPSIAGPNAEVVLGASGTDPDLGRLAAFAQKRIPVGGR